VPEVAAVLNLNPKSGGVEVPLGELADAKVELISERIADASTQRGRDTPPA
jgi:hypothetical protein